MSNISKVINDICASILRGEKGAIMHYIHKQKHLNKLKRSYLSNSTLLSTHKVDHISTNSYKLERKSLTKRVVKQLLIHYVLSGISSTSDLKFENVMKDDIFKQTRCLHSVRKCHFLRDIRMHLNEKEVMSRMQ